MNRLINFVTWEGTSLVSSDSSSINNYGVRKKKIGFDLISNGSTAKINAIMDAIRDEFKVPKREFHLDSPINYQTLRLNLKDKVQVDYPTIYKPADNNDLPRWGQVTWGNFRWPIGQFSLTIEPAARFKIIGRELDLVKGIISFNLREV